MVLVQKFAISILFDRFRIWPTGLNTSIFILLGINPFGWFSGILLQRLIHSRRNVVQAS